MEISKQNNLTPDIGKFLKDLDVFRASYLERIEAMETELEESIESFSNFVRKVQAEDPDKCEENLEDYLIRLHKLYNKFFRVQHVKGQFIKMFEIQVKEEFKMLEEVIETILGEENE